MERHSELWLTLRVKAVLRSSLWWTSAFRQWSNRDLGISGLSSEPFRLGSHDDRFLWTTLLRMSAAADDDVIDDVTWPEKCRCIKEAVTTQSNVGGEIRTHDSATWKKQRNVWRHLCIAWLSQCQLLWLVVFLKGSISPRWLYWSRVIACCILRQKYYLNKKSHLSSRKSAAI